MTHLLMHVEERAKLVADALERPRLVSALRFDGVAVHGVGLPHDNLARRLHGGDEPRQVLPQQLRPHAHDDHDLTRLVARVDHLNQLYQLSRVALVAGLRKHTAPQQNQCV